uniref:Mediator of RNA polymerase II transcription subunit 31 n=1 Tax=Haemonchus placei TaxID=6290 RepID=A0A0N4WKW5_HAEPC
LLEAGDYQNPKMHQYRFFHHRVMIVTISLFQLLPPEFPCHFCY